MYMYITGALYLTRFGRIVFVLFAWEVKDKTIVWDCLGFRRDYGLPYMNSWKCTFRISTLLILVWWRSSMDPEYKVRKKTTFFCNLDLEAKSWDVEKLHMYVCIFQNLSSIRHSRMTWPKSQSTASPKVNLSTTITLLIPRLIPSIRTSELIDTRGQIPSAQETQRFSRLPFARKEFSVFANSWNLYSRVVRLFVTLLKFVFLLSSSKPCGTILINMCEHCSVSFLELAGNCTWVVDCNTQPGHLWVAHQDGICITWNFWTPTFWYPETVRAALWKNDTHIAKETSPVVELFNSALFSGGASFPKCHTIWLSHPVHVIH